MEGTQYCTVHYVDVILWDEQNIIVCWCTVGDFLSSNCWLEGKVNINTDSKYSELEKVGLTQNLEIENEKKILHKLQNLF